MIVESLKVRGPHLHHDFPFLTDISKQPPSTASSAVQSQPPGASHSNIHAIRADGSMCEGIACRNVLLRNAYVLHPKAGPSLLLAVSSVGAKETAGAASCCLTHHQQPIVCLQLLQAMFPMMKLMRTLRCCMSR